jgi:hypothetical protein
MQKGLDRQLADERARHPTPREAARRGDAFGLLIWAVIAGLDLAERLVPSDLHAQPPISWRAWLIGIAFGLVIGLLSSVLLFALSAAVVRWGRRRAARHWYPDRRF